MKTMGISINACLKTLFDNRKAVTLNTFEAV